MRKELIKMFSSIAALRFAGFFKSGEDSKAPNQDSGNGDAPQEKKLIGSQVFFRHGARTPLHVVPSDGVHLKEALWKPEMISDVPHSVIPYRIVDLDGKSVVNKFGPVTERISSPHKLPGGAPYGQLTRDGQADMFALGQRLRERYVDRLHLIPSTNGSKKTYCRSTFIRRNIISARCVLAGLFGHDSLMKGKEPFPIHVCPKDPEEILFMNTRGCNLLYHMKHVAKSHKDSPLLLGTKDKVSPIIGLTKEDLARVSTFKHAATEDYTPLYYIRDDLVARRRHGFELPAGLSSFFEAIDRDSAMELGLEYMGDKSTWEEFGLRAAVGCVCRMILENVDSQIARSERIRPLMLFATHDSLLVPLLLALGLFDGLWPKFAASVYFEIYENASGDHFVQIYYNDHMLKEFSLMEFKKRLQRYAMTDKEYFTLCSSYPNSRTQLARTGGK